MLDKPLIRCDKNDCRDAPADRKDHHQHFKIRLPGKDRVYPGNAGAADAEQRDESRYERAAVAAHGPGKYVDKRLDDLQAADVGHPYHAVGNDGGVAVENT